MKIVPSLFEPFLKCPTKCWLRATGEMPSGNTFAEWVQSQDESFRAAETERLLAGTPPDESARSPSAENLKTAKWQFAVDIPVRSEFGSNLGNEAQTSPPDNNQNLLASAATIETCLHAVERIPSAGRGQPAQFVPIRFIHRNKLTKDDKLLLAFDAFVLSEMLGRTVSLGKIIHGDDHATLKVKTPALAGEVRKRLGKITALLASPAPPDLVLNRHCAGCEFQARCRKLAVEKDDLSLLAGMSAKERQKLRSKGISTVTQLSYTFRPRRRPRRQRDKREKYHHALKALAIREQKIHIVGSPELKFEGTPVYLDVEGLPDRDFYYLIGVRIGHGESAVQHSLWADTVADEGRIWCEFLALLETIEQPVLIHYGSYETVFFKRMEKSYGIPTDCSRAVTAINSSLNLLSVLFGQIYFPTHSNGLKEIARCCAFAWSDNEASGTNSIAWRYHWEICRAVAAKQRLTVYNEQDCEALERICSIIERSIINYQAPDDAAKTGLEIVRAEAISDDRLQKWKEFKSPFPEFECFVRAAHWDYQRSRVFVKPHREIRRQTNRNGKPMRTQKIYREVLSRTSRICPGCKKRKRGRCQVKTRCRLELFTGRASLKVRLVKYDFQTYFCRRCNLTFGQDDRFKDLHRFGWSLATFLIYQIVGLNIPQRVVSESFSRIFGITISVGALQGLKAYVANYYRLAWQSILDRIAHGRFAHADETNIHLHDSSGFVWVLTNLDEVAYIFSPSREAELPKDLLSEFRGVLVTDFYAAYDSLDCRHQRCLIHLIRDLNDEVLDNPYDEELKTVVASFGELLKPIIETVGRRGLKPHFLRKFKPSACRFFAQLEHMSLTTDAAQKCRQRFIKNKDELFTFLDHDGVPWNNNNAEHAIKAVARLRSNLTGLTTQKGLEQYLILLSVCQTCKYMGVDFLDFLRSGEKDIHAFAESRRRRNRPARSPAEPTGSSRTFSPAIVSPAVSSPD